MSVSAPQVMAAPVIWANWTSGTAGASGSAAGIFDLPTDINISYTGEIAFIQTAGGTNYWNPSAPYISGAVSNAPPPSDIIALSLATTKTLTFSAPIDNLFFAVASLNGNGYRFNEDFEILSFGNGYWGGGTLTKTNPSAGVYQLNGSGEPHGVIRFNRAVSSITWTSLTNEYWNGFTVGTYGAAVPEPEAAGLMLVGVVMIGALARRRKQTAV